MPMANRHDLSRSFSPVSHSAFHYRHTDTSSTDDSEDDTTDSDAEDTEPTAQLLKQALSPRSVIAASSSSPHVPQQPASSSLRDSPFRIMGLGTCGTVFEVPESPARVLKKGGPQNGIWTDFCLTNRAHKAFLDARHLLHDAFPDVPVPRVPLGYSFYTAADEDETFSSSSNTRFPASHRARRAVFCAERIPPLPATTRGALITRYFAKDRTATALSNPENQDCLVRIYLGERGSGRRYDTLRNFPMMLDMWEEALGDIEVSMLAEQMAVGLAVLHWRARVDGMDVELVLGGRLPPPPPSQPHRRGYDNLSADPHRVLETEDHWNTAAVAVAEAPAQTPACSMWILDFDKASPIAFTANDVKRKLVPAFMGNDPYYPLPRTLDQAALDRLDEHDQELRKRDAKLWKAFRETYLRASGVILRTARGADEGHIAAGLLPELFVEEVERRVKENEVWDARTEIVFA